MICGIICVHVCIDYKFCCLPCNIMIICFKYWMIWIHKSHHLLKWVTDNTKFLWYIVVRIGTGNSFGHGLQTLSSKPAVNKPSSICFMLRILLPIVNVKMLRMVYFAHFYSQISYGIIFGRSSSSMRNVFTIQKRAIRIMLWLGPRCSCREGFKKLDILTVPCLYIYA